MSIKRLRSGKYLVQVQRYGQRRTARVDSEDKAKRSEKEFEPELEHERETQKAAARLGLTLDAPAIVAGAMTFGQMFEEKYLPWAERKLSAATRRARESTHKHLLRFFGPFRLADITTDNV